MVGTMSQDSLATCGLNWPGFHFKKSFSLFFLPQIGIIPAGSFVM
jgi:hypothetical protein